VEPLIQVLEHPYFYVDGEVRVAVYEVLGQLGDRQAVEPLIRALGCSSSYSFYLNDREVVWACEALGRLGDRQAVEPLIKVLERPSYYGGHKAACKALGWLGDRRAVKPLIQALERSELYEECLAVCQALISFTKSLKPHLNQLLCRSCLTRFDQKTVFGNKQETIHATGEFCLVVTCRLCGGAADAMFGVREVIAVLDAESSEEIKHINDKVRVNWLKHQVSFDFDCVEVIRTSEYEVERFCVQVGNDTDSFRRPRYRKMLCTVDPQCGLSPSILNMLKNTFGEVTIRPIQQEIKDR
jgi:hypothetical protein